MELWLMYLGVFLGMALRTVAPYLNLPTGTKFEWKYAATALVSLVLGLLTAPDLVLSYVPVAGANWYVALLAAFVYGLGLNHVVNETVDKASA